MHTFTRQQRQGGVRYAAGTLVGNYFEDVELQSAGLKDFMQRKATGTLKTTQFQERMSTALAPVDMTKIRDDPYVHFGDVLQLVHVKTGCLLAVDVEDKDPRPGEQTCAGAGSAAILDPVARNTFLISKHVPNQPTPLEPQWEGDVLRYAQKIRLLANPMAQGEPLDAAGGEQPLALYSRPLGVNCAAKFSRHQLAAFTWKANNFDSVWQIVAVDPADRLASEGVEVLAGAPLLLVHCGTQAPLNLEEGFKRPSDFGIEFEVSAHAVTLTGKQLALEHQARGETSKNLPKPNLSSNQWAFVTGSSVGTLPGSSKAALGLLERLIAAVAQQLQAKPGARHSLEQKLVLLPNSSGCIRAGELVLALRQVGVELSEDEGVAIAAELAAREQLRVTGTAYRTPAGQIHARSFLDEVDKAAAACR